MLNVAFVREPVPRCRGPLGERQAFWETKAKRMAGGLEGVSHAGVALSPMWGTREQVGGCVWSGSGGMPRKKSSPLWEKKKNLELYFLQPDIKKITKHKSIRGQNYLSLTRALLSFPSVSLDPQISAAFVYESVCVRQKEALKKCLCHSTVWNQICIYTQSWWIYSTLLYWYIHECITDASGISVGIFLIVIFYTMTFFEQSFTFLHGSVSKLWFLIVLEWL